MKTTNDKKVLQRIAQRSTCTSKKAEKFIHFKVLDRFAEKV